MRTDLFTTAAHASASALRTEHAAIADAERLALLDRVKAGETVELYLDAVVYAQADGRSINRNFWRLADDVVDAVAADAVGKPFLTDHDTHDSNRNGGNIVASEAVRSGDLVEIRQTIHITKPAYVQAALEDTFRRFSIQVYPKARAGHLTPSLLCSLCKAPLRACMYELGHYPGAEFAGQLVEVVVGNADFLETSAVSVPAVTDSRLLQLRPTERAQALAAALTLSFPSEHWTATCPIGETPSGAQLTKDATVNLDRLSGLLGLAAGADTGAIEKAVDEMKAKARETELALKAAQSAVETLTGERDALKADLAKLEAERLEADAKAFADAAVEQGKVTQGKLYDLVVAAFKRSGKEAEELVAALPVVTQVNAEPQSKRAVAKQPKANADGTPNYEALVAELNELDVAAMKAFLQHTTMKPADYVRLNYAGLAETYGWSN